VNTASDPCDAGICNHAGKLFTSSTGGDRIWRAFSIISSPWSPAAANLTAVAPGGSLHRCPGGILYDGKRVASHARSSAAYRHTTVAEHMPKSHQAHLEWTPSRLIHWADSVGPATAQVVRTILEKKPDPEMGYRACLGILRLEKMYSQQRLEAASQRAVQLQTFSYQSLKSILKRSLDRQLTAASGGRPSRPAAEKSARAAVLRSTYRAGAVGQRIPGKETYVESTNDWETPQHETPRHGRRLPGPRWKLPMPANSALRSASPCCWISSGCGKRTALRLTGCGLPISKSAAWSKISTNNIPAAWIAN